MKIGALSFNFLLAMGLLAGCESNVDSSSFESDVKFSFSQSGNSVDWNGESEKLSVNAYIFSNSVFTGRKLNVPVGTDNMVSLNISKGGKVFFTLGSEEPQSLKKIQSGVSTEADLGQALMSGSDNASYMYSSDGVSKSGAVELVRTVARLDLDLQVNGLTRIEKVAFENLALETKIFEEALPYNSSSRYNDDVQLEPAVTSTTAGIKYLYESAEPIKITVYGTYNDIPITASTQLESVTRNKVYKLQVVNAGASVNLALSIRDWAEGGKVESDPDVNERILIDESYSSLPEGVESDLEKNSLKITGDGASFTMAFLSDSKVDIAYMSGITDDVIIGVPAVSYEKNKVCTKIPVTIAEQGKGKLAYQVKIGLKSALREHAYDYVNLTVGSSRHQIQTVTLAGITWMQFNARSRDLEDQIYPIDGASVEYMYENNWLTTVGGLFQWGRMYMYTPWLSGLNNAGEQTQDKPWVMESHVPCPDGYRVPTYQELKTILPDSLTIPGSHTVNGETIDITLHRSGLQPAAINGVSVNARYLKLTSQQTGNSLFIPLSGYKWDKSTTTNPQFGHGFVLWSNEYHSGGYSNAVRYWPGNNVTSAVMAANYRLPAESFSYVRCVKSE